jgi:hypothetical protein
MHIRPRQHYVAKSKEHANLYSNNNYVLLSKLAIVFVFRILNFRQIRRLGDLKSKELLQRTAILKSIPVVAF